MSYFKILIDTSDIKTSRELDRLSSNDPKESLEAAIQLLEAIKGGNKSGLVSGGIVKDCVPASALISIDGAVSVDDNVTVNGTTFTAKAITGATGLWFQASDNPAISAGFLGKAISSNISSIESVSDSGKLTLTVYEPGSVGNDFHVVKGTGANITVTDFADGDDGSGCDFSF